MRTLKLALAYDGTDFVGWQRQAQGRSVQGVLEDALSRLDRRDVVVVGAGRTDSGVHALGQVASATVVNNIEPSLLLRALNASLPPDLRILDVTEAAERFSARFSATSKTYCYRIFNAPVMSPFERRYAWHRPRALDLDQMRSAAHALTGRHDFAAFQASGSHVTSSVRTIEVSQWREEARPEGGRLLIYEIRGNGFLRYMVRNIVGTLVEVGSGRSPAESVREVLAAKDRSRAGPTAPPHGLYLVDVLYQDGAPERDSDADDAA